MKVVLHQFPQSHYCIRIRWAMAYKKIPFEVQNYTLSNLDDLLKVTKNYRKVPVLQWNNEIITDSPNIVRFLEEKQPTPTLFPAGTNAAQIAMFNAWIDSKVFLTVAKWFVRDYLAYLNSDEDRERYQQVFIKGHRMEIHEAIARHAEWETELLGHWRLLEEVLTATPYVLGTQMSYADLAIASRLKLMNMVNGYRPTDFPKILAWSDKIFAICP